MRKIRYGLPLAVAGLVVFFAGAVYSQGGYPPDFQLKQTGAMAPVNFSHKIHAEKAKRQCTDCHTNVFQMKVGGTTGGKPMTMVEMNQGKYCGACHNGKVAFPVATECLKCHPPKK